MARRAAHHARVDGARRRDSRDSRRIARLDESHDRHRACRSACSRSSASTCTGPTTFLIALLVFLLILGAILDIFSATVLIVPLLLPIAAQYGIDPIHLGIVFLAAMELGYLDAAGRAEPVHREPSIREGHHGNLLGNAAISARLVGRRGYHCLLAGFIVNAARVAERFCRVKRHG